MGAKHTFGKPAAILMSMPHLNMGTRYAMRKALTPSAKLRRTILLMVQSCPNTGAKHIVSEDPTILVSQRILLPEARPLFIRGIRSSREWAFLTLRHMPLRRSTVCTNFA